MQPRPSTCVSRQQGLSAVRIILLRVQDNRQTVFTGADDNYLCILGVCKLFRCLDALPPQKLLADSLRDDRLEVSDAFRLDSFSIGFLFFLCENEFHPLTLLLGPLLLLDCFGELARESNISQRGCLGNDSSWCNRGGQLFLDGLSESLPFGRIECTRLEARGYRTADRAELRRQYDILVVAAADFLLHAGSRVCIEPVQDADFQTDGQPLT